MSHITIRTYVVDGETGEQRDVSKLRKLKGEYPNRLFLGFPRWPACRCPLHR